MNFCPYCGTRLKIKNIEPNFCSHCGKDLRKMNKNATKQVQCAICHKYVEKENNKIICPFCGSQFHLSCAHRWFLRFNACPLCQNRYLFPRVK